jgi:hypothetical protein
MDWITVSKKQRKEKKISKPQITDECNLNFKLLNIKDYTLTKEEQLKINGHGFCCYCCDNINISKIIIQ